MDDYVTQQQIEVQRIWVEGQIRDMKHTLDQLGELRRSSKRQGALDWSCLGVPEITSEKKVDEDTEEKEANAGAGAAAAPEEDEEGVVPAPIESDVMPMVRHTLNVNWKDPKKYTPELLAYNKAMQLHVAGVFNATWFPQDDLPEWLFEEGPLRRIWEDTKSVPFAINESSIPTEVLNHRISGHTSLLNVEATATDGTPLRLWIHATTYLKSCNSDQSFYDLLCNIFPPYVSIYLYEALEMVQMRSTILTFDTDDRIVCGEGEGEGERGVRNVVVCAIRLVFKGSKPILFCMPSPQLATTLFGEDESEHTFGVQWAERTARERDVLHDDLPSSIVECIRALDTLSSTPILQEGDGVLALAGPDSQSTTVRQVRSAVARQSRYSLQTGLEKVDSTLAWQRGPRRNILLPDGAEEVTDKHKARMALRALSTMLEAPVVLRTQDQHAINAQNWFKLMERVAMATWEASHSREKTYRPRDLPSCSKWNLTDESFCTKLHWGYNTTDWMAKELPRPLEPSTARRMRAALDKTTMVHESMPFINLRLCRSGPLMRSTPEPGSPAESAQKCWAQLFGEMETITVKGTIVVHRRFRPYGDPPVDTNDFPDYYMAHRPDVHIVLPLDGAPMEVYADQVPDPADGDKMVDACEWFPAIRVEPAKLKSGEKWRQEHVAVRGRLYHVLKEQLRAEPSAPFDWSMTESSQREKFFYEQLEACIWSDCTQKALGKLHAFIVDPLLQLSVTSVTDQEAGACTAMSADEIEADNEINEKMDRIRDTFRDLSV